MTPGKIKRSLTTFIIRTILFPSFKKKAIQLWEWLQKWLWSQVERRNKTKLLKTGELDIQFTKILQVLSFYLYKKEL